MEKQEIGIYGREKMFMRKKENELQIDWKHFYLGVLALVIPMALQNLINVGVTAADVVMLGRVGETALSGSSLAGQVQYIMTLFLFGLTSGATVLTAQYWGKKDLRTIEKILGLGMRAAVFVTALLVFLTFLWGSHRLIFILCEVWNGSLWQRWYICVPCSATLRSMPF